MLQEWGKRRSTVGNTDPEMSRAIDRMVREGRSFDEANAFVKEKNWTPIKPEQYQAAVAHFKANPDTKESYGAALYKPDSTDYTQSVAGQALSGINEGIASVVGAPVDLAAGTLNLIPRGLNALANTNLPTIVKPILGSDWIKGYLQRIGSINEPASTPGLRTVRRVGESVGAAAIPAGFSGSLARAAGQLVAGAGGGAGAAAAQQAFPGNTIAELAGEVAGGGFTGSALASAARRNAQRSMAAQVPTIPQLKQQAGELYRQAEARGVVADPVATRELADNMRAALTQEGRISPTGRISEVYPKAREGMQLVEDYAGQPMTPTQMQTVRKVATDGLTSSDSSERRLAGILTDVIDQWANPRAPELAEA
ncbi:MAG TPA: hypothetical protein VD994_04135, partial [Prosthecobacter sp.]|nr:hypothetical protein [Prosthecobacter sp.]